MAPLPFGGHGARDPVNPQRADLAHGDLDDRSLYEHLRSYGIYTFDDPFNVLQVLRQVRSRGECSWVHTR